MTDLQARGDLERKEIDAPTLLLASVLPHLEAEPQFDLHAGQRLTPRTPSGWDGCSSR